MRVLRSWFLLSAAAIGLMGCLNPALTPVQYDKPATVKSDRTAQVRCSLGYATGDGSVGAVPVGGLYVPFDIAPNPKFWFGTDDQQTFVTSLVSELNRLGIARATLVEPGSRSPPGLVIELGFLRTRHKSSQSRYYIDATLSIEAGGKKLEERLIIDSGEGDSALDRLSTSAVEGKMKAAKKLMNQVIPLVEKFLREMPEASPRITFLVR